MRTGCWGIFSPIFNLELFDRRGSASDHSMMPLGSVFVAEHVAKVVLPTMASGDALHGFQGFGIAWRGFCPICTLGCRP